jgi:hypothetical protein
MAPINPGAYTATALGAGVSAAQQEQIVANHKDNQISYAKYLGTQEAGKELFLYGVGDDALAPPKKAMYQLWGCNQPHDDQVPTQEDGNKNDNIPKVQLQNIGIQEGLGPNNEHNCLLHRP